MSVISVLDNALQTTVKSGLIEFNDSKKAQIFWQELLLRFGTTHASMLTPMN